MRIFVLTKQVPGTSNVKMDEKTGAMIRTEHENVMNPLDENALEEAIRLKRSNDGATVSALSMGPLPAMKALREAIALGADSAALLCHRKFAGSDTLATARALSAAIRHIAGGPLGASDLVLCGERATDGETGQVGPMIASLMGLSIATYVRRIRVEDRSLVVERVVEDGFERLSIPMPALVTVVKDINQPGFPTLAGKLLAKEAVIPILTPDELDLSGDEPGLSGSPTRVVSVFRPSFSRNTVTHSHDGTGTAIDALMKLLEEKNAI